MNEIQSSPAGSCIGPAGQTLTGAAVIHAILSSAIVWLLMAFAFAIGLILGAFFASNDRESHA